MIRPVPLGSFLTLEIRKSPSLAQHLRLTARNRKKVEECNRKTRKYINIKMQYKNKTRKTTVIKKVSKKRKEKEKYAFSRFEPSISCLQCSQVYPVGPP